MDTQKKLNKSSPKKNTSRKMTNFEKLSKDPIPFLETLTTEQIVKLIKEGASYKEAFETIKNKRDDAK